MTRFASFFFAALLPLFAACSASHGTGDGGMPDGDTPDGATAVASYVATVTATTVDFSWPIGIDSSGLDGQTMRLDALASTVTITPRWGSSVVYDASDDGHGHIVLSRADPDLGAALSGYVSSWQARANLLTLTVDGSIRDGRVVLGGGAHFDGPEFFSQGDEGAMGTVHATLSVVPDGQVPDARFAAPTWREGQILPWDTITAQLAEPLALGEVAGRFGGTPGLVAVGSTGDTVTSLVLTTTGWWPSAAPATVALDGGYADLMGNTGAPTTMTVRVLGDVEPVGWLTFDPTDAITVRPYGAAYTTAPDGFTCEDGHTACGAMQRADFEYGCSYLGGFFVHLVSATPVTQVSFRARAVTSATPYPTFGDVVQVHVALAENGSREPVDTSVAIALGTGSGPGSAGRDSGWQTMSVMLPHPMTNVGVVIDLPTSELCSPASPYGGPPLPPQPATVLVDDVTLGPIWGPD